MVALDRRATHLTHPLKAFGGVGIVANDITHADVIRHILAVGVLKDGFQSFLIGMNITEKSYPHGAGMG